MATELRVPHWIDAKGNARNPLKLAELGNGFKVLYLFQAWCPGCHSHGFPTLKRLVDAMTPHGFGFAAIQTVFEGRTPTRPNGCVRCNSATAWPFPSDTTHRATGAGRP